MLGKLFGNWALRSRAKMLMQELKWELEASDPAFRARVSILANMARSQIINPDPLLRSMVDDPFQHSETDLAAFYNQIENVRNADKAKHRQLHKFKKSMGNPSQYDFFDEKQTNASQRSLEIWMATLAMPIAKNGLDYGAMIWNLITVSDEFILKALEEMRALEQALEKTFGDNMGLPINDDAVVFCRYRPSCLS